MGLVGSKTRSLGQILDKPCVGYRDQIFGLILMKLGQSVCLDEMLHIFLNESCRSKRRSLGQIIEDPMLLTKGLSIKSLLFNDIPQNLESSGVRLQGHHGPLVTTYFIMIVF